MKDPGIKYGLIAGFIGILLQAFTYLMGVQFMATWWVGILILVAIITMYVILSLRIRKDMGGYITFKDAFIKTFVMCIIAGTISTLFGLLLYHVIDPELPDKLQNAIMEKTMTMMENMGAPQEKIDEVAEQLQEAGNNFSVGAQIKNYFVGILFGAIFALIMGAIIKKARPVFEDTPTNV
ncbi:MAG: DUF4199 domain-containing protein [Bacteroidetes bacterium]|nr:DUF4199 domain-containing protein [Bacteroidota bacterium]